MASRFILSLLLVLVLVAIAECSNQVTLNPDLDYTPARFHYGLPMFATTTDVHKDLMPLDYTDYMGFFFAIIGLMLAAGGGIGGGGILVPIYVLVMDFSPKLAVPLSNVTILGGAIANMTLNARKRHPKHDKPLVDWDIILIMEPPTIGGALVGSFLNKILPEVALVIMLVFVLAFTAYRSLSKGIVLFKKETLLKYGNKIADEAEEQELLKDADNKADAAYGGLAKVEAAMSKVEEMVESDELKQILEYERYTPYLKVLCLTLFFIITLLLNYFKVFFTCGTIPYTVMIVSTLLWVVLISAIAKVRLVHEWEHKVKCGYHFHEGDVQWTPRNASLFPVLCSFAGLFAGMFGVGGGIVKGPLMLEMGVLPEVTSGTSACMILYTSFTATTSYLLFGLLREDYATVLVVVGFLATLVGQIVVFHFVKKLGRSSLIIIVIGLVVAFSTLLLTWQGVKDIVEGNGDSSTGFCSSDSV